MGYLLRGWDLLLWDTFFTGLYLGFHFFGDGEWGLHSLGLTFFGGSLLLGVIFSGEYILYGSLLLGLLSLGVNFFEITFPRVNFFGNAFPWGPWLWLPLTLCQGRRVLERVFITGIGRVGISPHHVSLSLLIGSRDAGIFAGSSHLGQCACVAWS